MGKSSVLLWAWAFVRPVAVAALLLAGALVLSACGNPARTAGPGTPTAPAGGPTPQAALRIAGTVSAVSLSAGVIVVTSTEGEVQTISVQPTTAIRDAQNQSLLLEQITPGMRLEATGGKGDGSTMLAGSVKILGPAQSNATPAPPPAAPVPATPTAPAAAEPTGEELRRILPPEAKLLHQASGDLDGDGRKDVIAIAAFGASPDGLSAKQLELFIFRPGAPAYTLAWRSGLLFSGQRAAPLEVRDLNRDGRPEVLSTQAFGAAGETLYVLGWQGNRYGAYQPQGGRFEGMGRFGETAVGVADRDGDGIAEIAASYGPAGAYTDIYRWDGKGFRYVADAAQAAATPVEQLHLRVYFTRVEENEVRYIPVTRIVPRTPAMGRTALLELLKGPTGAEKTSGLHTAIPPGVELRNLRIEGGTASADFSKALDSGISGSAQATAVRRQITLTLQQFSTVQRVEISVEGRTEGILQP